MASGSDPECRRPEPRLAASFSRPRLLPSSTTTSHLSLLLAHHRTSMISAYLLVWNDSLKVNVKIHLPILDLERSLRSFYVSAVPLTFVHDYDLRFHFTRLRSVWTLWSSYTLQQLVSSLISVHYALNWEFLSICSQSTILETVISYSSHPLLAFPRSLTSHTSVHTYVLELEVIFFRRSSSHSGFLRFVAA